MPDRAPPLGNRLALHHWTLETTPLADFLRIARDAGWNAVELRRSSFTKCFDAGMSNEAVIELLAEKGYAGYLSYEAPNPEHWSRPPEEVAREGASATRALLAAAR